MVSGTSELPRLDGGPIDARPGETLVQALARRGWPVLGRSTRYHRPRAPFCGTGSCSQCLVRVNGQSAVRACTYVPAAGDRIATENGWPSVRLDALGVFDLVFYRGIDTLHGFRRPQAFTAAYHWAVRRLAGFGRLPAEPPRSPPPIGQRRQADVAVVGAGTSGRAAAVALAAGGRRVIVLDRRPILAPIPGAEVHPATTAFFLPPPVPGRAPSLELLAVEGSATGLSITARAVILANGGYDAGLIFEGNDRPGVMTAEGAEAMLPAGRPPPFAHAVIFGGGERVGGLIERFPDAVEAVVAPGRVAPAVAEIASRHAIPIFPRTLLVRAAGRRRVGRVELRSRGDGRRFAQDADAVILAHRRLPLPQLAFQVGARMEFRAATGAYHPAPTHAVETSVNAVYAVGELAGYSGDDAAVSGQAAAARILGRPAPPLPPPATDGPPSEMIGYLRELRPALARGRRAIACPCEDILLHEVEEAVARGYRGIEVIKRMTGLGTGLCQGRYCLPDALLWLSILEDRPPNEVGYITQRPPVLPVALEALAGVPAEGAPT